MDFIQDLKNYLAPNHLLKHSFYQSWRAGTLHREQLQHYVKQYYPFVNAFPRFVSAAHSLCDNEEARRYLLENLAEEEGYPSNASHPELWTDFAEALGVSVHELKATPINSKAKELAETFSSLSRSSYPEALGALYAYEHQVPEIAKVKIEGLQKNFGITSEKALRFFEVHQTADQVHSETAARLLSELGDADKTLALKASSKASQALWDFLTEVEKTSMSMCN